jgi:hypothetical protein
MMHCWQFAPADRPTFKQLAAIFELFLSEDSDVVSIKLVLRITLVC